jgi:hypothetical protein
MNFADSAVKNYKSFQFHNLHFTFFVIYLITVMKSVKTFCFLFQFPQSRGKSVEIVNSSYKIAPIKANLLKGRDAKLRV